MRPLIVVPFVLTALLLGGCTAHDPVDTPVPSPSTTPVFASDEEALAAAESAYRDFVEVTDQIFEDGGGNPERIAKVATGLQLAAELAGFETIRAKAIHSSGGTEFDQVEIQQFAPDSDLSMVTIYVCEDISSVDVIDSSGVSVVSPDRPSRVRYEVVFDYSESAGKLLVSLKDPFETGC